MTQIAAGTQHNVVPDTCRFVADVRTTDAYTNEETVEILRRALRSEVTPRSTRIRASALNAAHPLARATAATGRESYVSPTTSDMALMPFPSLKMGPESSRSHTADEFVLLSEIEEGIGIYEKFIKQLAEILDARGRRLQPRCERTPSEADGSPANAAHRRKPTADGNREPEQREKRIYTIWQRNFGTRASSPTR